MQIRDRIKELRRVKASELKPSPANWRSHPESQQNALRGVLSEIGYADCLIARELPDGTLELVDGHLRAETTPDMEVPVLITDLDEAEAKKVLLTLDPLAGLAESDTDQLKALLDEVETDSADIQSMLDNLAIENDIEIEDDDIGELEEPEAQVDRAMELQEKWGTAPKQLWTIDSHWCKCPDCGEVQKVPFE